MERALDELRQLGAAGCVVLGYPDFYGRFGFKVVPELILPDMPPEDFLAIAFGTETPAGEMAYHAAFDATS
jgi:putative acetyltransferase